MYSCFFIGHQTVPQAVQEQLDRLVEYLVSDCEVSSFVVGSNGDFDKMAVSSIQRVKKHRPGLFAYQLAPYTQDGVSQPLPEGFDGFLYGENPRFLPIKLAQELAAKRMIQSVKYLVCYICRKDAAVDKLMQKALADQAEGRLRVLNLPDLYIESGFRKYAPFQ